jgi:hypothetical protein
VNKISLKGFVMFWSEHFTQKTFFDGDVVVATKCMSELMRFSKKEFPDMESDFHRRVAFLTHEETQNFLGPMLSRRFGSIDNAKMPTLNWLESIGSFETLARLTRKKDEAISPVTVKRRKLPQWYQQYCKSSRFISMKENAKMFWENYFGGNLHCSVNARHEFEVFHHSDYARLGEGDEFRYLVPLCHACHQVVSARGPRVSGAMPESVKQWL